MKLDFENASYARRAFLVNYGEALYKNHMYDEAKEILETSYKETLGQKDMWSVLAFIESHANLTNILIAKGEYEIAFEKIRKGLEYAVEFEGHSQTYLLYICASNYYRQIKKYEKAIEYLLIAKKIILKSKENDVEVCKDVLLEIAEVYEEQEQYEEAFNAYELYHKAKENLVKMSDEIQMQALIMDTEFELNKKNNKKLEKLIYRDQLTGLYNKKKLLEFEESISNEKFGILLIDIDDFKSINDCYGHHIGDEFLIMVADILDKLCKDVNLFRYAGDEFVIVNMNATEEEFQKLLLEIRRELSEVELLKKGNSINISGGIAISNNNESFEDIFKRVDCLMYENKRRNKSKIEETTKNIVLLQGVNKAE